MFKWLWFYIVCWKHRDHTSFEMFEQYTLILKAARRCAYDLNHSASDLWRAKRAECRAKGLDPDTASDYEMYNERSDMWLRIFSPTGGKDYRHDLHYEIDKLEFEISRLKEVCIDNNIDPEDPNGIPF